MTWKRLAALVLGAAFAVGTGGWAQNADIRHDEKQIRKQRHDIYKDSLHRNREVREARRAYRRGKTRKGNHEMADARKVQRDINRDKRHLARERRDLRRDRDQQ